MSAVPAQSAAAEAQLRSAIAELVQAVGSAASTLSATQVAVAATARRALDELRASVDARRAAERLAALGLRARHQAELAAALSGLPASATAHWGELPLGEQSQESSSRPTGLVRIGDVIAQNGQGLLTEALLPNPMLSNITLSGPVAGRAALLEVIETLLLRSLAAAPAAGLRIHVLDPHHNGTSLPRFGKADTTNGGVFHPVAVTGSDIKERLDHLARRVATVSQKFLQGRHDTLADYNADADVPEPHHVVVALDVPRYGNAELSQLTALARTGAPCGVHVLALVDPGEPRRATDPDIGAILGAPAQLTWADDRLTLRTGEVMHLVMPSPAAPTELVHALVERAETKARQGGQRAIPLTDLLRDVPRWGPRPGATISAPIGRSGTTTYEFALDVKGNGGVHALIAGMTGMGKSTLLHAVITSLAHKYSPDDLNLYLVDGKDGVEFRSYAPQRSEPAALPHARVIAVKSDIEMYLSVLDELDEERQRRSQVFAEHEVADIVELAEDHPHVRMPRIVAVLDEFHVLLTDPVYGTRAAAMLNSLAKQGRNAGIHLVLATQSLNGLGAWGPNKGLFEQIGLRIALKTKDTQSSETVLGAGNEDAARLTRRGEALANSSGDPTHNVPLQVALVDKDARATLKRELAAAAPAHLTPPFVFDGTGLTSLASAPPLLAALAGDLPRTAAGDTQVWIGGPVEVSETVGGALPDRRGGNLAVLGTGRRDERDVFGVLVGATLSAAAQHRDARFVLLAPRDDHAQFTAITQLADVLTAVTSGDVEIVAPRAAVERVGDLAQGVAAGGAGRRIFVVVFGASRILEPHLFAPLVEDGPATGLHVFGAWASRAEMAAATLPKGTLGSSPKLLANFELRVMSQLPAEEQSGLGIGRSAAPDIDRMLLWRREDPNKLTTFIPFDADQKAGWEAVLSAVRHRVSDRPHPGPAADLVHKSEEQ